MSQTSKWMIGFGVALLGCAAGSWSADRWTFQVSGGHGLAMIAAGAAAAQGRASLRRAGVFFGFLLPAVLAAAAAWRAMQLWILRADGEVALLPPLLVTCLAAAAIVFLLILVRLRILHRSSIAERGYSVTTPAHYASAAPSPPTAARQRADRM